MDRRISPDRRGAFRGGRRVDDLAGRFVVLVVDDHADSRELMGAVLEELGVALAEAATGEAALRRAVTLPQPHVIFIDLGLPDRHGTDVVRTLKADHRTAHIPAIALSASVMAADKDAAAAAGCSGFIEKPVLPETILSAVRRMLTS